MQSNPRRPCTGAVGVIVAVGLLGGIVVGQSPPAAAEPAQDPLAGPGESPSTMPAAPVRRMTPAEKVQEGFRQLELQDPQTALVLFGDALAEDPEQSRALLGAAEALAAQQRRLEAIDHYRQYLVTSEGRTDWRGHFGLGLIYLGFSYYHLAKPSLQAAYRLSPQEERVNVLLNLANAHRGLEERQQAITCGERALQLDPGNALIHQTLATLYSDVGSVEGYVKATTHADTALKIIAQQFEAEPGNLQLLSQLDLLYNQVAGIYQQNIKAHTEALYASGIRTIEDDPKVSQLMVELARTMARSAGVKRLTGIWRAIAVARRGCEVCPSRSDAWFQLAQMQFSVGQAQDALASFQKAVDLRPKDTDPMAPTVEEMQLFRARLEQVLATSRPAAADTFDEAAPQPQGLP